MVENFIPSEEHLKAMLTELRKLYASYLKKPDKVKLKNVSQGGTVTECITEVHRLKWEVFVTSHRY